MPTAIKFPSGLGITGSLDSVEILDANGDPVQVLDHTIDNQVEVKWSLAGNSSSIALLGGSWSVQLYVESMGQGYEGPIGLPEVQPLNGGRDYTATPVMTTGLLAPVAPDTLTVYKLVAVLSHTINGQTNLIAGFGEGPFFEVR